MDPIALATATSALTVLAGECARGAATEVGKDIWSKAKGLFGWTQEPAAGELPKAIATELHRNDELLSEIMELLAEAPSSDQSTQIAGSLVGNLRSEKVVVAQKIDGGIKM